VAKHGTILHIIHRTQTDTKFYYIQGHLSMQDSAVNCNPRYIASGRKHRKHRLSTIVPLLGVVAETYFPNSYLAMDVSSGSTIPAYRHHVTISLFPWVWCGSSSSWILPKIWLPIIFIEEYYIDYFERGHERKSNASIYCDMSTHCWVTQQRLRKLLLSTSR
jgi:hypothetical protein